MLAKASDNLDKLSKSIILNLFAKLQKNVGIGNLFTPIKGY